MREINFRAWDRINKRMVHVWSIHWKAWDRNVCDQIPFNKIEVEGDDGTYDLIEGEFDLMQYTGIRDVNGREIYEGDIVECDSIIMSTSDAQVVEYGMQGVDAFVGYGWNLWDFYDEDEEGNYEYNDKRLREGTEVIGNIYENSELLKESEGGE